MVLWHKRRGCMCIPWNPVVVDTFGRDLVFIFICERWSKCLAVPRRTSSVKSGSNSLASLVTLRDQFWKSGCRRDVFALRDQRLAWVTSMANLWSACVNVWQFPPDGLLYFFLFHEFQTSQMTAGFYEWLMCGMGRVLNSVRRFNLKTNDKLINWTPPDDRTGGVETSSFEEVPRVDRPNIILVCAFKLVSLLGEWAQEGVTLPCCFGARHRDLE